MEKTAGQGTAGSQTSRPVDVEEELTRLAPDRRLDQNFLIDRNNARIEVEAAGISPEDTVLEIGPGKGLLTEEILLKTKKIIIVEKDMRMVNFLTEKFSGEKKMKIIGQDILKLARVPAFDRCVSNIPYSLSSKIIIMLGELGKPSVLMLQKEFAERLVAKPGGGEYSRISVMAQYYFTPEIIKTVSRKCFYPRPKVESAIVRLEPVSGKRKKLLCGEKFLFTTVRALFCHKNKKVSVALVDGRREFGIQDKEKAREIASCLVQKEMRVRDLGLKELAEIAEKIKPMLG